MTQPAPFPPAPLDVDRVLTADWLSAALSLGRERVEVRDFEEVDRIGPSALKIRLRLDLAGPGAADVPDAVCIKGVFDPALSAWLKSGAQQAEAWFYRDLAPRLSVRVPRCFYAGYDPETGAGHVVMEDLVPRGARFLSAMSPYSQAQAERSLDQLARLHAGTWNAPADADPWVTPKLGYLAATRSVPALRLTELMRGERGEALPDDIRDGERIYAAIAAIAERDEALERCYVHGDSHAGNVWESAEGTGLIDWQVLQRGHWSLDVAYHVAAVLDVEHRREKERDLLALYGLKLGEHGGPTLDPDDAWRRYREALPYGLLMWAMTQRVEPAIVNRFVTRLGTAVADHDAFKLLGS